MAMWEKIDSPKNPTQNYLASQSYEAWAGFTSAMLDSAPLFTLLDVPRMLRDERVQLCLRMLIAPFQRVKWKISASSPAVAQFANTQTKLFWRRYLPKIMRRYFKWGFAPIGWEYSILNSGKDKGKIGLKKVDIIEPLDAHLLEYKKGIRKNQFAGFSFPGGAALVPYASWFAGEAEINRYYDFSRLRGAFAPWLEKNGRTGAKHSRRLAAASAWDGGSLRYPLDSINLGTEDNPQWVSGQEYAQQIMSKQEAGVRIGLPNTKHRAIEGEFEWTMTPAKTVGNLQFVMDYPKDLDREIDAGMGVLTEMVESTEQGGWSGKQITAEAFYTSEDELIANAMIMWQETPLKYMIEKNFGPSAECEITTLSLVDTVLNKPKPAGTPSQPGQPGFGGVGSPGGQSPLHSHNPVDSEDLYGGADEDDKPEANLSDSTGEEIQRGVRKALSGNAIDENAARRAVALAMVHIQEEATARGNPNAAEGWLDELADLAKDPALVAKIIGQAKPVDLAWQADGASKAGRKRWLNPETGERRYQESKPGTRAEARQIREASDTEATKILDKVTRFEASAEDIEGLAHHLPAASIDKLRFARKILGASFGGKRRRQDIVNSLLSHVQERARGQRAGEEARGVGKKDDPKPETGAVPEKPDLGKVYDVDPKNIEVDPERFQFKLNTNNPAGVTDELKGVRFNKDFSGVVSVWKDPADGKTYVVNGHHRHDLAKRTNTERMSVRYLNAPDAQTARGKGALINIAEGRGTAIDAAKFMRDTGVGVDQFEQEGLSFKGAIARDASELAKLSDPIFNRLVKGDLDNSRALAIAANIPDVDLQNSFLNYVEKTEEKKGVEIAPKVVASMAKDWAKAPTKTKVESTLFGDEESKQSLFHDRHELKSYIDDQLGNEARDFEAVSSEKRAERVSGEGNKLETEKNRRRAFTANRLRDMLHTAGNWSELLDKGAEEHANANTAAGRLKAKREYLERIRSALSEAHEREFSGMGDGSKATSTDKADGKQPITEKEKDEIIDLVTAA